MIHEIYSSVRSCYRDNTPYDLLINQIGLLYQDIIEFVSDDYRVMKSQILMDDGTWNHFMTAHYRRQ